MPLRHRPSAERSFRKKSRNLKRSFRNFLRISLRNLPRNSPRKISCFPGRSKSPPPKFHQIFPTGMKFQIEFQIKFHQKFHKHTSAGLATLTKNHLVDVSEIYIYIYFFFLPGATLVRYLLPQECPRITPKKRAWCQPRRHVCIAKFLLRSASRVCGQPLSTRRCF